MLKDAGHFVALIGILVATAIGVWQIVEVRRAAEVQSYEAVRQAYIGARDRLFFGPDGGRDVPEWILREDDYFRVALDMCRLGRQGVLGTMAEGYIETVILPDIEGIARLMAESGAQRAESVIQKR